MKSEPRRNTIRRRALPLPACLALLCLISIFSASVGTAHQAPGRFLPLVYKEWPLPPAPGRLLLTEVLYNPEGDEPMQEWVEVGNPGESELSLDGFRLGDTRAGGPGEGLYVFPDGVKLGAGKAAVIANCASFFIDKYGRPPDFELHETDPKVPNLIRHPLSTGYDMVLNNSGDDLFLLDEQDRIVDQLSWGSSTSGLNPPVKSVSDGHSLERYPSGLDTDRASDWIDQARPNPGSLLLVLPTLTATPGEAKTPPVITSTPGSLPSLLISEVLYDPVATEPQGEWIELYNWGTKTVDLSGCKIGDQMIRGGPEGMLVFPEGARLPAGGVLIIANQASSFIAKYHFSPDFEANGSDPDIPDLEQDLTWGSGPLLLNNGGDEVLLLDRHNRTVDAISWGSSNFFLDPPIPGVKEGQSIERFPAYSDQDLASDWRAQASPGPGSLPLPPATPSPTHTTTPTHTVTPTGTTQPTSITPSPTATVPHPPAEHLLIAEVYYKPMVYPLGGSNGPRGFLEAMRMLNDPNRAEWIEIYNPGPLPIDLSNYKIGDEETEGGEEGMYRFPEGATIPVEGRIVVAQAAMVFLAYYGFLPDFEIDGLSDLVPNLTRYSWGKGIFLLYDVADEVVLLDEADQMVDVVSYGFSPFPGVIPHPRIPTGHSLERYPPAQDTGDCSIDFIDQKQPNPGDPPGGPDP